MALTPDQQRRQRARRTSLLMAYAAAFASTKGFTPSSLFAAGEQGVWFDPSDFSSMFQDSAGTTPVTAVGQAVGRINDKSGRGNNATQGTSAARPILQQDASGRYYLDFDGTDDTLATSAIDFSATDKVTGWAGVNKVTDLGNSFVYGNATTDLTVGSFGLQMPYASATRLGHWLAGSSNGNRALAFVYATNTPYVVTSSYDIGASGASEVIGRVNGVGYANTLNPDSGTGNFGNHVFRLGGRSASLFFSGRIYSVIVVGRTATAAEIASTEAWVNSRTGAY